MTQARVWAKANKVDLDAILAQVEKGEFITALPGVADDAAWLLTKMPLQFEDGSEITANDLGEISVKE